MQLNQTPNCSNCGSDPQKILHHIRHRGIFRRLCTSCVLRLHPQSFCPTCFTVYNNGTVNGAANNGTVTCVKCYSLSHSNCVVSNSYNNNRYVCPLCVSPGSPVFVLKEGGGSGRGVDLRGAKVLVAAAMISSLSMSDAEVVARSVAERRAKEAASTRKKATQALDYMAALAARERVKKGEALAGSGVSRFGANVGSGVIEMRDEYVGNVRSDGVVGMNQGVGVDGGSNVAITRGLEGGELRENERVGGVGPQGSGFSELAFSDGVAMDEDERRGMSSGSGVEVGDSAVQEHDAGALNEISGYSGKLQYEDGLRESENNGVVLHPPKEDWMEGVESNNHGNGMQGVESTNPGQNENGMQQ